jgi:predicted Abi (CAAX) family protease
MECIKVNYLNKPFYHYERNVNPHSITMDKNSRFNLSADGILLNFRKLLLPYPHLWNTWVEFEMPWISYLCLYYHSFDAHRFKEEFHYLLDKDLRDVNALVKLALKNYFIASMLMKCRRMFSILLHK